MGDFNWQMVETIIDEVLELPQDKRPAFIEEKCSHNQELKGEVTRLLDSIFDSEGWLEDPNNYKKDFYQEISEDVESLSSGHSLIGHQVGSYIIKEQIGEGGMGSVYIAERTNGAFEHEVAIKIIKRGRNTHKNILRFHREQQILAGLNHPGIGRLYDGGVTEDGFPYIIMEYVDGIPIDEYCSIHNCSVDEKIALFKQVLEAVRYAHENLVIHRDLKPGNILVDGSGDVKILDFGISKLLEDDENLSLTQTGARLLTPRYAAPEQIRQENITTSCDLYALGTVFYKLLAGSFPFNFDECSRYEMEQIILNETPLLPSAIAKTAKVKKQLKGDLDAIMLKAIRKDPEDRYRGITEFLDDLVNYQRNLPVNALKRTSSYRINKFFKRHKKGATTAAGVLLLLVGLTAFYAWRITQERNQAQQEAQKAEQVTEFLVSLFESSNPYLEEREGGTDVTVGSILKFGSERIDSELSNQPVIRAELKTVLGEVYDALNEYEQAEKLLTEAIEIRRNSEQTSNFETANSIRSLAFVYQEEGNFDEAGKLLQESISFYNNSSKGLQNHDAISAIARLGNLSWYNKGDYEKADSLLNRALVLRQAIHDSNHVHIAINYNDLATLYHAKGDYKTAESYYRESIDIYSDLFEEHSNLAIIMANFSALFKERGDYREAEEYQRASLSMHRDLTGAENIDIALGLGNLGDILLEQNRLTEVDSLLNNSLSLLKDIFDTSHTYIARTKLNIGRLHLQKQNYARAKEILLETKREYEELFPENHPRRSDPLLALGNLYLTQHLSEQAQPYLEKAVQIREEGYGEDNWRTAQAMSYLGTNMHQLGRFEQAEPLLVQSYDILDEIRADNDKYRMQTLNQLIQLYEEWGKPKEKENYQNQLTAN